MDPDVAALLERVENDFTYHPPTGNTQLFYARARNKAKELAQFLARHMPPGREQSLALTKLEEAIMWANAGVARHGAALNMEG